MSNAVPVIMYHSVGEPLADWAWNNLTTPVDVFESQLKALARAGYRSATLAEFAAHVDGTAPLAGRRVVLTFDDGYLDNWSHAAPLLEKYGFTGTVLATVEFVDPDPVLRPTLRDVWAGKVARNELDLRAFMSWEELRAGAESGVLDVQSHAYTHTWYPVSESVVDFHHPGDAYYWLDWNANPAIKPRYLKHLDSSWVPYGVPVYAHEKSLKCRRYFPDPSESEHLAAWVHARGGTTFFDGPAWREALRAELNAFRARHGAGGRVETDAERAQRIEFELADSRRVLREKLGRDVDFLVWPGGGYDDYSMDVARRHYRATTVSSAERWRYRNRAGENPGMIVRRGAPTFRWDGRTAAAPGGYVVDMIEEFRGSRWARRRRQFRKLALVTAARARLWRPRP